MEGQWKEHRGNKVHYYPRQKSENGWYHSLCGFSGYEVWMATIKTSRGKEICKKCLMKINKEE
jgi:hypothetical protein